MANVKSLIINGIDLLDLIYPIGSIFETTKQDFDPNVTFNGTWVRVKGKVLVGVDEDDTDFASSTLTGGEKTHTLLGTEMPIHNHGLRTVDGQNTISGWSNPNRVTRSGSSYDIIDTSGPLVSNAGGGSSQQSSTVLYSIYVGKNSLVIIYTSKEERRLNNGYRKRSCSWR